VAPDARGTRSCRIGPCPPGPERRFAQVGDPPAAIDDVAHSLEPLLELSEAQGQGDEPCPPGYPKMPASPSAWSRDRDRKQGPKV
jgi:hypothetical protein